MKATSTWRNRHWKRLLLTPVLLCHVLVAAWAQSPNTWRDSLTVLNRLIAQSPWSTDLHLRKAAVNLELQQWQYAADEYGLILQREPQNLAALFYRAYAHTHLHRYDLARNDYEGVLQQVPRHLEARLGMAYACQQQNHRAEALEHLNMAVEQHPDSAVAYAARAALERTMQQYDAALYDWAEASRLAPSATDYLISHVDLLLFLERRSEARRLLDEAVRRGTPRGLLRAWYNRCR